MNTIVKETALIAVKSSQDLRGFEGYFVRWDIDGTVILCDDGFDPLGVLTDTEDISGRSSVAVCGAYGGIVKVKLRQPVAQGDFLVLFGGGQVVTDPGSGVRRRVARAMESGNDQELIDAVLMTPLLLT